MIGTKELHSYLLCFGAVGSVSAAAIDAQEVPVSGFITAVMAANGTTGTDGSGSPTQNLIYDILLNNTSIFTTNKINFTHTTLARTPQSYGDLATLAPIAVVAGDVLEFKCTQILNGTNPVQPLDPTLIIRISRPYGGGLPALVVTGKL